MSFEAPLAPTEIAFDLRAPGTWSTLFREHPQAVERKLAVARYGLEAIDGHCHRYRFLGDV